MGSIRWLHLSDVHVGMKGMGPLWPSVQSELLRDLEVVHRLAGPFDLVLFSGDLTQTGQRGEFERLTDVLEDLWDHLRDLGSRPVLLAVPGNHDLQRPDERKPDVRALLHWPHDPLLSKMFWEEKDGKPYRDVVEGAFAEYVRWIRAWNAEHPAPTFLERYEPGLLPGEFAASLRKEGVSLGVVGLNSAFLQLSAAVKRGGLALNPAQLQRACNGDPQRFAGTHDVNLLMTHHPPDWLAHDALAFYQGSIFLPGWFDAHLCGHMHEAQARAETLNAMSPQRLLQGPSLFGLEHWGDDYGERLHGYSAGRLEVTEERHATLRVWPRMARRHKGTDKWRIVPDHDFMLDEQNGLDLPLAPRKESPAPLPKPGRHSSDDPDTIPNQPLSMTPSQRRRQPEPPGMGYNPQWYVPHELKERLVLNSLRHAGAPIIVTAPPVSGKSTLLWHLVGRLRAEDPEATGSVMVLPVDLGSLSDSDLADPAACLRELATLLVESYAAARRLQGKEVHSIDGWVDSAWQQPGAPERRLKRLFERQILAEGATQTVLVLDRFDRIVGRPAGNPVARMLRTWMDNKEEGGRWSSFRLLLGARGSSLYFYSLDAVSELFASALHVRIESFNLEQLRHLASLYGGVWTDEELRQVHALVDGQPFFSRLIFFLEAQGTAKSELLNIDKLKLEHCSFVLQQIWLVVSERPELRKPLCALLHDPATQLSPDEHARLYQAGFIRKTETGIAVSNMLLASYFRERC